jgi:peroxiredoxin
MRKRLFVLPFLAANALLAAHAAVRLGVSLAGGGGREETWGAALVAHGAPLVAIAAAPQLGAPRVAQRLAPVFVLSGAATAWLTARLPDDWAAAVAAGLAGLAGTVVYHRWYSRFGRAPSRALRIGEPLPDATFEQLDGSRVSTAELPGVPVALFFFRGNWCPFCMAQVREVVAGYDELERAGVRVLMVSPQPDAQTRELAERFGAKVEFLRDPDLAGARELGIVDREGVPAGVTGYGQDTVLPTLVVLDHDGRVLLADQTDDYRLRPTPRTVLEALAATGRPAWTA